MAKKKENILVIVESPTKAKTIGRILGKEYLVEASMGHLRDLPKSKLGVDTEHDFEPEYIIPTKSRKTVTALKKLYEKAGQVVLATDEDREGEAIAWHITEALKISHDNLNRIVFHEITDEAVKEAIAHPRKIDMNLVNAQQARRVLDRLVGYKLSPLLWKKIFRGLSAGRVQSVAVRLIVEREREREQFKPEEYWKISAVGQVKGGEVLAELSKIDGETAKITNGHDAEKISEQLKSDPATVFEVKSYDRNREPAAPLTTSTLQQQAGTQLGFSVKKTMVVAQQLYEGLSLGGSGHTGLITYMRTDSVHLADKAVSEIRDLITTQWGADYLPKQTRSYKTKSKGAQEAHEAIRPTSVYRMPASVEQFLSTDQFKLYRLIWERTVASQMATAVMSHQDMVIKSTNKELLASGVQVKFAGFLKVYAKHGVIEKELPKVSEGESVKIKQVDSEQKFTEPPARYSEPTLVKTLEKLGIGRPSTYAPTITTIITRGYVRREKRQLIPQEVGILVNDFLVEHFPDIIDYQFTAKMEEDLDDIAEGQQEWRKVVKDFYDPFAKVLAEKEQTVVKKDLSETTDEICPNCGAPMIIRLGRFGKFLACSKFPECKTTKNLVSNNLDMKCPKCEEGQVVVRRTKRGKVFYGCSNYPKCDFASWDKPTGAKCPTCGGLMVEGKKKWPVCAGCGFEDKEIK